MGTLKERLHDAGITVSEFEKEFSRRHSANILWGADLFDDELTSYDWLFHVDEQHPDVLELAADLIERKTILNHKRPPID